MEAGVGFGLATYALLLALRRRCVEPLADQALLSAAGSGLSADFGRGFRVMRQWPFCNLYVVKAPTGDFPCILAETGAYSAPDKLIQREHH